MSFAMTVAVPGEKCATNHDDRNDNRDHDVKRIRVASRLTS